MTLKQFLQLAAGALVSLILYASPLPGYIKWPLVITSFLFGAALAFLPFEDRPLSSWLITFFRAVYSPTVYKWIPYEVPPVFFQPESTTPAVDVSQYLKVTQAPKGVSTQLEEIESQFLQKISTLSGAAPAVPAPTTSVPVGPEAKMISMETPTPSPQPAPAQPAQKAPYIPVSIPITPLIKIAPEGPKIVVQETPAAPSPYMGGPLTATSPVQFSTEVASPITPTQPNTIVGQVLDTQGKIVVSAILEVKDSTGRPVRALKSNKLGHFVVVTPLAPGRYEIVTEKEGLVFTPVYFDAKDEIIPPIAIKAARMVS